MNVSKIQKLSEQHADLKRFHTVCNRNGAKLTIQDSETTIPGIRLDYVTTKSIIAKVRSIVLDRICAIEKDIKEETENE